MWLGYCWSNNQLSKVTTELSHTKSIYEGNNMNNHNCFVTNKYYRLYCSILETHVPKDDEYTEIHHIIPRSLGGNDCKTNLKRVSARVHFICHYLLTKCTEGINFNKMVTAFNIMAAGHDGKRYKNSRLFYYNRKHMSKIMSELNSGCKNSQYGKIWMKNSINGKRAKFYISDIEEARSQNWFCGSEKVCFEYRNAVSKIKRKQKFKELAENIYKQYHDSGLDSICKFAIHIGSSQPRITMLFSKYIDEYKLTKQHGKKFGSRH